MLPRLLCLIAVLALTIDPPVAAQSAGPSQADGLGRAQAALLAGDAKAALAAIDPVIRADPRSREAASVRISALLLLKQQATALRAYDEHVQATGLPDAALLSTIAEAELRRLASAGGSLVRIRALEALALRGDPSALETLATERRASEGPHQQLVLDAALASAGDAAALRRLHALAQDATVFNRTAVVQALQHVSDRTSSTALQQLLRDRDPLVKAMAAETLASLGAHEAIPDLLQLLQEPMFHTRLTAAVALRRLGDPRADPQLQQWLWSDVPDVRILAAQAYAGGMNQEWKKAIEPLLGNPEGLVRLRAAGLLATSDPARAMPVLLAALSDPNPAVRTEASRIIAESGQIDLAMSRKLLDDSDPSVRLHAAQAILGQPAL